MPEGFSDLVKLIVAEWDWDKLLTRQDQVWDALLYPIFLGATVRSAQAAYVKEILGDILEFKAAQTVPTDPKWSKKAATIIQDELKSIAGTPGEGFKRAILQIATQEIETLDLSRTIGTALHFFGSQNVTVSTIKSLENDARATLDFVDLAARSIYNVRYIKAVLWLYGCGIARELVPPNSHVTRFLNECGYPGFGWSRDPPEDWQVFTPACNYMKDVAKKVASELKQTITPKQAQAAVWYLQTCRGLLPQRSAKKLTPFLLIDFLKAQKWDIHKLSNALDDIEQLENLASDLKASI